MAVDLATLGIEVDSREVKTGTAELDKLAAAGQRADAATDALAAAQALLKQQTSALNAALKQGGISQEQYNRGLLNAKAVVNNLTKEYALAHAELGKLRAQNENVAGSTKLAGYQVQNLAYQMNDLVVGLASGQKPMTVFMQQGSQIAQIMAQAGVGVGGLASSVGGMVLNFAKAHPLLIAAGVAVGALVAGFNLLASEINKTSAVQVTWQDVALGTFDVIRDAISERVTAAFQAMGIDIGAVWDTVTKYARKAINAVIGIVVTLPKAVGAALRLLPGAFGDAFFSGVNLAIRALNTLARAAVAPLNGIVMAFNQAFGTKIPAIVIDGVDEIANPFAGGMAKAMSAAALLAGEAFGTDFIAKGADALSAAAQRRTRMREAAEEAGKKAGKAGGKAGGAAMADEMADTFAKQFTENMVALEKQILAGFKGILPDGDKEYQAILDGIKAKKDGADRIREAEEAWAQQDRQRALDTANDIADIIGGSVGRVIGELADALDRFEGVLPEIGKVIGGLNLNSAKLAGMAGLGSLAGGGAGGSLGGIVGGIAGEKLLGSLGSFAGPVGSIVGGLLGGIIGGLLKKTPKASATVSIIAGEAMDTVITGNKGKLKAIAGEMAGSLIDGLADIADALGAELTGDAKVSIGIRKKSYRVDPTGGGATKTSKGAVDFGEDQAAAIAYAIQDAIKDGVLGGLSASIERLITGDGDLQSNLEKALAFKGVFDELFERTDPLGFALSELDKQFAALTKIFDEAGASAEEYGKLDELFALKRADAIKDNSKADEEAADAADMLRQKRELEIALMNAQGLSAQALAATRALELEGTDATLRALKEQVWAAQDAAAAQAELAAQQQAAAEQARAIAAERYGLETQLLKLQGDTAALRERELATLDPSNRLLQLSIFAMEDAAQAANELAKAQADQSRAAEEAAREAQRLADEAARVAEEAAAAAAAIASERYALETRLLQELGNTAALRARELEALDPSNRELLNRIFALQDEKAANDAAAKAAADAADALREAAEAASQLARQRRDMEIELLDLQGKTAEAEAMRRADILAALDPSLRELQQAIFDQTDANAALAAANDKVADSAGDAAAAQEDYARRIADAKSVLLDAYKRESGELENTIDKFRGFADAIREFRAGLSGNGNPATSLARAKAAYTRTARMAGLGDEGALSRFTGDAQAYLDAAREGAGSYLEYQRAVGQVSAGSANAINAADSMASQAQRQLFAMERQVGLLIDLNENTVTVADAIRALDQAQRGVNGMAAMREELVATRQAIETSNGDTKVAQVAMAVALNRMERILASWDRDGAMSITNDADTPITVA